MDPGMGRTGLPIDEDTVSFADAVARMGVFAGWHG